MQLNRVLLGACALALLGACQAPHRGMPFPAFRLQAASEGQAAVRVAPTAALTPASEGVLTVRFAHLLGARQLLATVADVESLTIHLSGTGVDHTETISKAMITGGMTSFTFTGLPAGALTVTIRALDASGQTIGADTQQATVTAGQTTVVASTVLIVPSVTQPRTIVAGSGGAGGGATGSLTTTVTLQEGTPVQTPALLGVYTNGGFPQAVSLARDNQGNVWFTGGHFESQGLLKRVSPAGTVTTHDMNGGEAWALGSNPDGSHILVATISAYELAAGNQIRHCFAPDGSFITLPGHTGGFNAGAIAGAADGTIYTSGGDLSRNTTLTSYLPNGTIGFNTPVGSTSSLRITSSGDGVFSMTPVYSVGGKIQRRQADGTLVFDYPLTDNFDGLTIALDGQDNVWFARPTQGAVCKLSPAGVLLASYPMPVRCNAVTADSQGRLWAYQANNFTWSGGAPIQPPTGAPDDLVMRLGPDGKVQAYYHIGLDVEVSDLLVTPDDHLWVASPNKGLLHLDLASPATP